VCPLIEDVTVLIDHLDFGLFTIPRIDCPEFTFEGNALSAWVSAHIEISPDRMVFTALLLAAPIVEALAFTFGPVFTVVLPKTGWIFNLLVDVNKDWTDPFDLVVEVVLENHVSVTDRLIAGILIQGVRDSNGDVTLLISVVLSAEGDIEVAVLPASD
jgi:hypothetical protein